MNKVTIDHDVLCVLDYFRKYYPALIVPGASTSIGNIYVECRQQKIKPINIFFDGPLKDEETRCVLIVTDDMKDVNGEWSRENELNKFRITEFPTT